MHRWRGLERTPKPDWQALLNTILRRGTPARTHHIELIHDWEIVAAIADRFRLRPDLPAGHPDLDRRTLIAVHRFLEFDYVRVGLADLPMPLFRESVEDTAGLKREGGRHYQDEHRGPIMSWEDFHKYPWPDPRTPSATRELEWFQANLPEDMCIIGSGSFGHFAEMLTWLMGYETFCFLLYDQPDLVQAVADKLSSFYTVCLERILQFPRVKLVWGSDDMGFKTGLLFSPTAMRTFVLAGHKRLATMSHAAGRPYLLHSCGNLTDIIDDLVDDVKIDAKHSFEDTIEDVRQVKHTYGRRIAMLGGIDVDFLCRADETAIRQRVRETLDICQPGGGYCLGSGNTVANYIPLDNYLAMVDEGRLYGA